MAKSFKKGDTVEWTTPQGQTVGTIKNKLTKPTHIKTHKVAASPANPEYLVESLLSGKQAAHKPEELQKASKTRARSIQKRSKRK